MVKLKKVISVDSKIKLRVLDKGHAAKLFELTMNNRAYLKQWLPWVDKNTELKNTVDFIEFTLDLFSKRQGAHYGIFCPQLVGVIGFHKLDWINKKMELGYWLGESLQGKGIMTKACQAMIKYAFSDLNFNRAHIACATRNHKSSAIPKRLGFRLEGTLKEVEWVNDHF
ncbi:MAG: GNAT family N-acetyltransferase, partial [Deltaproteobacteria bacterium]|nr:GNAT family N-acetyltransferase [Deltaproteobacteria bacterium]